MHRARPRALVRPRAGRRRLALPSYGRRALGAAPPRHPQPVSYCCPGDSPLFARFRALYPPWKMPRYCLPDTRTAQVDDFRALFFRRYPHQPSVAELLPSS